jgi:hypothetical protein
LLLPVQTIRWLVLDDPGVKCSSEQAISYLNSILEIRRWERLFTIFINDREAQSLPQTWYPKDHPEAFENTAHVIECLGEYRVSRSLCRRTRGED